MTFVPCHIKSMEMKARISDIEARLKSSGISVAVMVREAGISPSTWTRWKGGSRSPGLEIWSDVEATASRLIAKKGKHR